MEELKRGKDGFIELIKKKNKMSKDKKEKSKLLNPFKKGSRKWYLFKTLLKHKVMSIYSGFHNIKQNNYFFVKKNNKNFKVISFKKSILNNDGFNNKDAFIMINIGNQTYVKISTKSYKKLVSITKMIINYRLIAVDDDDEKYEIYSKDIIIDSINDLFNWINYYRQLIDGVAEIQSDCCNFTFYKYKVSTIVFKENNKSEVYTGDFNDFMKKYGLLEL